MAYPLINSSISAAMSNDLTEIFRYADLITSGWATFMICFSFFLLTLIGSLVAQQKYTGNIRVETSLLASSFLTMIFEVIMMQKNLLSSGLFLFTLFMVIISFIWVTYSTSEPGM